MANKASYLHDHPILSIQRGKAVHFTWKQEEFHAFETDTIASALIANGIHVFQHHHKDHSPQGIYCANGQCSQCLVLVNGSPRKACMELIRDGMQLEPLEGLSFLPAQSSTDISHLPLLNHKVQVLVIGGGPAGLSAAIELGSQGIQTLLVDDKGNLGGKLVLQTHRFFGSKEMVYAGTRGIDIATILSEKVQQLTSVETWLKSPVVAVFSDHQVGILKNNRQYALVEPDILLIATGAREKSLLFPGNSLPGISGAGAFQTLLNRDGVIPGKRYFIVGGGNVGLITAYHALQAGIQVQGLVEIMPQCGGYQVHLDKIKRLGIPIYTSHTVLCANGKEHVESITIAQVDKNLKPMLGSEKTITCDGILIAAGLNPVDEFFQQAQEFGFQVYAAGDAQAIAEASAAIVSGKITAKKIIQICKPDISHDGEIRDLTKLKNILSSKPGKIQVTQNSSKSDIKPVFHCVQEIPCNPCSALCVEQLIHIPSDNIMAIPDFIDPEGKCLGCAKCVLGCPGLAITLVDYRKDPEFPFVSLPYELPVNKEDVMGLSFPVTNREGTIIGNAKVINVIRSTKSNHTTLIKVLAPVNIAEKIAGIQFVRTREVLMAMPAKNDLENETIVCRCERVTAGEIRELICSGIRDLNLIKAISRAGMGACGGKTCESLILQLMKEAGIASQEVTSFSKRPLNMEITLQTFAEQPKESDRS